MKKHLANATFGVIDYASYPLGMAVVAPIVLHKLGTSEYGLWTIATAVVSTGGIIAAGFCDANIQRVARLRSSGDTASMAHTVRSMLGINFAIGIVIAAFVWFASPFAASRVTVSHPEQLGECLISLRIASGMVVLRAVEAVFASTQRAFELFSNNVRINIGVRWLALASAALLALAGCRTISIMAETAIFFLAGAILQLRQARKLLGGASLLPIFQPRETRILLGFGVFTWIQALGGVIFGQFDRVFVGVSLGAVAVAPYSLCVQFAHPIFGLTASALGFLFPYLSGRAGFVSAAKLKRTLLKAFAINFALVACGVALLLLFGNRLIELWAGQAVAQSAAKILPSIVAGSALMGLSVTGTYTMCALGLFRTVAIISLSSRAALLLLMVYLVRHGGLQGLATSRIFYGVMALLVYLPLFQRFAESRRTSNSTASLIIACEFREAPES